MGRSINYKSPSKIKRSLIRLVKHLFKILNMKPKLSLTKPDVAEIMPRNALELSVSTSCLTNYPEPCKVCQQNQCNYDLSHGLYFSLTSALEGTLTPVVSSSSNTKQDSLSSFNVELQATLLSINASLEESLKKWEPPDDACG